MIDDLKDPKNPEDDKENSQFDLENSTQQNQIEALTRKINELEDINKKLSKRLEEINVSNLESQIINFKQQIKELEIEKRALLDKSKESEAKQEYIGFLEGEISRLENKIENLQTSIQELEEENKIVTKSFKEPKVQEIKSELQVSETRRACPKCGNNIPSQIREMTDKTNIISDYPKVYGKKYQCGQCGTEWRKT